MGLYDRDYGREERSPWDRVENPRSITVTLIVINVVVFFVDWVSGRPSWVAEWFAVNAQTLIHPWMWWQFLTYGFVHDTSGIWHILFNMFVLYVFGKYVEARMGQMEFLRFYLVAIVVGGIVASVTGLLTAGPGTIGASGAVVATTIMFAWYYPNQQVLLMFVFPVKAWVMAVMIVAMDFLGALGFLGGSAANTAFSVHLAGAAFAVTYYLRHWNLRWLDLEAISELPRRLRQRSRRMKLKLHDPDKQLRRDADEADRILGKIHEFGEASLTSSERKTLERYSRRQREKRNE